MCRWFTLDKLLPADGAGLHIGIVCHNLKSAVIADAFRLFSCCHRFLLHLGHSAGDRLHPADSIIKCISLTLVQVMGSR